MHIKKVQEMLARALVAGTTNVVFLLEGESGIGKSQLVQQIPEIAKKLKDGKIDYGYCEWRPAQAADAGDFVGFPSRDDEAGVMHWLRPENWPTFDHGILFIDEPNRAQPEISQALFQLYTERRINTHKLKPGVLIVLAVNPANGKYHVETMCPAMNNRMCKLSVETNTADWAEWAKKAGVQPEVIDGVMANKGILSKPHPSEQFPSPRSWVNFSHLWQAGLFDGDHANSMMDVLCGLVGTTAASTFMSWYHTKAKFVSGKDILDKFDDEVKKQLKAQLNNGAMMESTFQDLISELPDQVTTRADKARVARLGKAVMFMKERKEIQIALVKLLQEKKGQCFSTLTTEPEIVRLIAEIKTSAEEQLQAAK